MVNIAKKHIRGEQLSAEQRQQNRSKARQRIGGRAGTPESQQVARSRWQQQQEDDTRQRVSREFARAMLTVFNTGLRFMNPEHIENRYELLDECIRTGYMNHELQSIYDWTQAEQPNISPHFTSSEGEL